MTSPRDNSPGVEIPPPLIFAAGLGLGYWLTTRVSTQWLPAGLSRTLGWILIACGLTLATSALTLFFRRRTTVRPDRPATALVTSGPYKFTRNPMYVSQVLVYAGLAILWQSAWALVLLPFVVIYIDRRVIRREESHLEQRFGKEYREYRTRIRRWL